MNYDANDLTQTDVREDVTNNNQQLITDLRAAAEYLEDHPKFVKLNNQTLHQFFFDAESFKEAARNAGSFTKSVDDNYYEVHVSFGPKFSLKLYTQRSNICKKVVKWECPDEGLLAMFNDQPADEAINE